MSDLTRRKFIQLTVLTGATAAAAGCDVPERMKPQSRYNDRIYKAEVTGQYGGYSNRVLPYVNQPDGYQDGVPQYFATACQMCPAGCGLWVRTLGGRAVQVQGNPDHPVSRGSVCARGVASLQQLYSPDRLRFPTVQGQTATWDAALDTAATALNSSRGKTVILTDQMGMGNQPTLSKLVTQFAANVGATVVPYSLLDDAPWRAASKAVYGRDQMPTYALSEADCILGFGADFLEAWPSPVYYGREFGLFRQGPRRKQGEHGKFIYVGPRLSMTAANADTWLPCAPGTEGLVAQAVGQLIASSGKASIEALAAQCGLSVAQLTAAANAFRAAGTRAVAMGGSSVLSQVNGVQSMTAIEQLNAKSVCVGFGSSSLPAQPAGGGHSIQSLIADMNAGSVSTLIVMGQANPVFTLPSAMGFAAALAKVPFVAALASFVDETTAQARILLPTRTFLEEWGDTVPAAVPAGAKVAALRQPVIDPVFVTAAPGLSPEQYIQDTVPWMDTRQTLDILIDLARRVGRPLAALDARDAVRRTWASVGQADLAADLPDNDRAFVEALSRGGLWSTATFPVGGVPLRGAGPSPAPLSSGPVPPAEGTTFALHLFPHIYWTDGRHANLGWMQENPDPMTSAVWNAWVEINMEVAQRMGIRTGDIVRLSTAHGSVEVAAVPFPGIHPNAVAMPIGQGHSNYGTRANERGQNPLAILDPTTAAGAVAYNATSVTLAKVRDAKPGYNGHETLVLTQDRPGGTEPEAVMDLIHTTAKEWKAAPKVVGPTQANGSLTTRGGDKAGNPSEKY